MGFYFGVRKGNTGDRDTRVYHEGVVGKIPAETLRTVELPKLDRTFTAIEFGD